jgi:hypothetical protein
VRAAADGKSTDTSPVGTVEEVHFLGASHEYVIRFADHSRIVARNDIQEGEHPLAQGSSARCVFSPEGLHLISN